MKKQLLLGVALGALTVATSAGAADLPVKAPVYKAPVVAPYNWTGWYAGGNIGYSWGSARSDFNIPDFAGIGLPSSFSDSLKPKGLIGGAQLGYNWQKDNTWVFGFEADFQGSAEKDSHSFSNGFNFLIPGGGNCDGPCDPVQINGTLSQTIEAKIQWFGTVRGRAGVLLNPTTLLYGTGGLAYGKVSASYNANITFIGLGTASSSFGETKTKFGWTLGAGIEGAIPNTRDWTWKAEYLYIDLGSISGSGIDPVVGPYSWSAKITDNIVRVGANYRFH